MEQCPGPRRGGDSLGQSKGVRARVDDGMNAQERAWHILLCRFYFHYWIFVLSIGLRRIPGAVEESGNFVQVKGKRAVDGFKLT